MIDDDDAEGSQWEGERPPWDAEAAASLYGGYVILGITTLAADGSLVSQVQMHGRVTMANAESGICIALQGARTGETYWLPPQPESFVPASPGEYRLRSTGEVVVDPDFTSSWTITKPATS